MSFRDWGKSLVQLANLVWDSARNAARALRSRAAEIPVAEVLLHLASAVAFLLATDVDLAWRTAWALLRRFRYESAR